MKKKPALLFISFLSVSTFLYFRNLFLVSRIFAVLVVLVLTATGSKAQVTIAPASGGNIKPSVSLAPPTCGIDILLKEKRKDALFRKREAEMNERITEAGRNLDDTIYTLPVVFHIIMQNPDSITDINVRDAVKRLNDIFGKAGAYGSSAGADTKIRFCLANKDPDGGSTTGITRSSSFFGSNMEPLIEDAKLKNLVQWDPSRYLNIWIVSTITTESYASFSCGVWTRLGFKGYAFLPLPAPQLDGVVFSGIPGGTGLAHEIGHYLGLYHTFEGVNCANNNCETDGDRVCDTPPDASLASFSCNNPANSCSTDTLSSHSNGSFNTDVPDQESNIMDYGIEACQNQFTEGQAKRMRAVIITQRSGLLQNACDKPCTENSVAKFTRNILNPVPGNVITFNNLSSGASNFSWYINDVAVSTGRNFSHTFTETGKYKVTLKAYNNDPACFASYSDFVIVNCGTTARFYTNKRTIASKFPLFTDTISFTNNSYNGVSYTWLMAEPDGPEKVVSTSRDYKHVFITPGNYSMRLVATNGSCNDTTEFYTIPVADPTPDGVLSFSTGQCYEQSKIKVVVQICNFGYAPLAAKIPITFYDADPKTGNAHKVGSTFLFPDTVKGNCCSAGYPFIVDNVPGLNQLYGVLNDNGTTMPLQLPNTGVIESNYINNVNFINNLQVKVTVIPASSTLLPGDTLQLAASVINGFDSPSYKWSSLQDLSCGTCADPVFTADKKIYTVTKQLVVTNSFGCTDTSYALIKIPPYNDFSITIDSIACTGADSMYSWVTVCNNFKRGDIPKGLQIAFYDADPQTSAARPFGPVYPVAQANSNSCISFRHSFKKIIAGKVYAVVNGKGINVPVGFPQDSSIAETSYLNNVTSFNYEAEQVLLLPSDTTVFNRQPVSMLIDSPVYDPSSLQWFAGSTYSINCSTCASPVISPRDSSVVQMQMANRYGCLIRGSAAINIYPPDLTIKILETSCYTNTSTLVKFTICMNNNYDSVDAGIPVSFYDGNPAIANAVKLGPVYLTRSKTAGGCDTFQHIINSPVNNRLFAVVNNTGNIGGSLNTMLQETDYSNNIMDSTVVPFKAGINIQDTTVLRFNPVQLTGSATGGKLTGAVWNPAEFLSCSNCIDPVVKPAFSKKYAFIAKNENYCLDTAYADINTFASGKVSIPNVFTPNNDRKNDIFYVMGSKEVLSLNNFSIYNRWGERVFSKNNVPPNDPGYGWDGTINNQPAPVGTYVYSVNIQFADGRIELYKGTVIVAR